MAARSSCPVAAALDLFGDRWTLLVVRDLAAGKRQFKELAASPENIATNILSDRLARLVSAGVIEKYEMEGVTGRAAYRLTQRGRKLGPVLDSLARWSERYLEGVRRAIHPIFDAQ